MSVYFSQRAERDLEQIALYLADNWSEKAKTDFLALLSDKLQLIEQMPELYRKSTKQEGLRECILTKQTILYYEIQPDSIAVFAIVSTRQNPDELI